MKKLLLIVSILALTFLFAEFNTGGGLTYAEYFFHTNIHHLDGGDVTNTNYTLLAIAGATYFEATPVTPITNIEGVSAEFYCDSIWIYVNLSANKDTIDYIRVDLSSISADIQQWNNATDYWDEDEGFFGWVKISGTRFQVLDDRFVKLKIATKGDGTGRVKANKIRVFCSR